MEGQNIRCREIADSDLEAVADLLSRGFPGRRRAYWAQGLRRQSERAVPEGCPRFGYLLEHNGAPVGVLLLLYMARSNGSEAAVRCNVFSWYVEPSFRSHAALLTVRAQKNKRVTYFNITPARPTWPIIEAQGFKRYCSGTFLSVPALSRAEPGTTIEIVTPDTQSIDGLAPDEVALLASHAGYGCLSLVCRTQAGEAHPFVFGPFRIRRGRVPLPLMQLIYCREVADFVRCSGRIGRFLLCRGRPVVMLDANGPVPGLAGVYTELRGRKYYKGPNPPRLADLSETELVLYGP